MGIENLTEQEIIQQIGEKEFGEKPIEIIRMTIGICNEVYELVYPSACYILRMNREKEWIYGTHKFLPLFQQLQIKTPSILAEDYSKSEFPYCYQILTKIEGKDLILVMDELSHTELREVAQEISSIFDKFNSLPPTESFGGMTGLKEEHIDNPITVLENQRKDILRRNKTSQVLDQEILALHSSLLRDYRDYFLQLSPRLFYDDICCKNVMIHNGKFSGLVDLDFLSKGDYLSAIGTIVAAYSGKEKGEFYVNEIIQRQQLDPCQQKIIRVYAILNLIGWTSEAGIKFNDNTSGEINWENVNRNRSNIMRLYESIS